MAGLIQQGAEFLSEVRSSNLAEPVVYAPLAGPPVTVDATINATNFQQTNGDGVVEEFRSFDFIVEKSAMATKPPPGSQFKLTRGATVFTYQVMPDNGMPGSHDGDSYDTCWRAHTKLVKTEAAP